MMRKFIYLIPLLFIFSIVVFSYHSNASIAPTIEQVVPTDNSTVWYENTSYFQMTWIAIAISINDSDSTNVTINCYLHGQEGNQSEQQTINPQEEYAIFPFLVWFDPFFEFTYNFTVIDDTDNVVNSSVYHFHLGLKQYHEGTILSPSQMNGNFIISSLWLNSIEVLPDSIKIDNDTFKIINDGLLNITITHWNTPDEVEYTANAAGTTNAEFIISGFNASSQYDIYVDGSLWNTITSNDTGYISFYYSNWSSHEFDIKTANISENHAPIFSNEDPLNNTSNLPIENMTLSININDSDGDLFNWAIETSPDIGNSSGTNEVNGTKTCNVTGLQYGTTYYWYVNATDSNGASSHAVYTFSTTSTSNNPPIITYAQPDHTIVNFSNSGDWGYAMLSIKVYDDDSQYCNVSFYVGTQFVNKLSNQPTNETLIWTFATIPITEGMNITWFVKVDDGINTITSSTYWFIVHKNWTNPSQYAPILFLPSPTQNETNVSIPAILQIGVYDQDTPVVTLKFYDENNNLLGITSTMNATNEAEFVAISPEWSNPDTDYYWFVNATDGTYYVRSPSTGFYHFKTANIQNPFMIFYIRNASNPSEGLYNVSINCIEKNLTVYSDLFGTAVFSFDFSDVDNTYHFIITKDGFDRIEKIYTVEYGTSPYYIKMTPRIAINETSPNTQDIFSMWNTQFSSATKLMIAFVILAILALMIGVITGNSLVVLLLISFGAIAFAMIGWIPYWIILIVIVMAAFAIMKMMNVTLPFGGAKE